MFLAVDVVSELREAVDELSAGLAEGSPARVWVHTTLLVAGLAVCRTYKMLMFCAKASGWPCATLVIARYAVQPSVCQCCIHCSGGTSHGARLIQKFAQSGEPAVSSYFGQRLFEHCDQRSS